MSDLALSPTLAEPGRLAAVRRAAFRTGGALAVGLAALAFAAAALVIVGAAALALAGARVWFR
jgi:hypothetical protein